MSPRRRGSVRPASRARCGSLSAAPRELPRHGICELALSRALRGGRSNKHVLVVGTSSCQQTPPRPGRPGPVTRHAGPGLCRVAVPVPLRSDSARRAGVVPAPLPSSALPGDGVRGARGQSGGRRGAAVGHRGAGAGAVERGSAESDGGGREGQLTSGGGERGPQASGASVSLSERGGCRRQRRRAPRMTEGWGHNARVAPDGEGPCGIVPRVGTLVDGASGSPG